MPHLLTPEYLILHTLLDIIVFSMSNLEPLSHVLTPEYLILHTLLDISMRLYLGTHITIVFHVDWFNSHVYLYKRYSVLIVLSPLFLDHDLL